ncbi:MAG: UvrB/UvrC motif-containing protein [Clostridia bacterium]
MKCERCHVNEASVKMVRIINNKKEEIYLCEECAQKENAFSFGNQGFSVSDFLSSFMGFNPQKQIYERETSEKTCEKCNMTWDEFRRNSRLGCDECYETFKDRLMPMIRQIHGHTEHQGRIPPLEGEQKKHKLKKLKEKLQLAIIDERYEDAATIRDEIKELEEE